MALKDQIKDPLNWVLLVLAAAFIYYVMMIPYWNELYLKTPQRMTMEEYLANPSHPRPFMLRALGAPPASVEVVITGLTVKHIDSNSILLTTDPTADTPTPSPTPAPASDDQEEGGSTSGEPQPPTFGPEAEPPADEILIGGDNMDLLEVSEGQQVDLQVSGLYESPMGWVPQEPTLDSDLEEQFSKEELDDLEQLKLLANDNRIPIPYIETGEYRLADGVHEPGEPFRLADLEDDTDYIQATNRLAGDTADVWDVRLVGWRQEQLAPYFVVEDDEGRQARVYYNQRLLSEWYWGLDRLGDERVVARGTLRQLTPSELRQYAADGNVQALIDGYALLSEDGSVVINLENPAGAALGTPGGS